MKAKSVHHQQIIAVPSDSGSLNIESELTRIHIIGTNRPLNQALASMLETFKDVRCTWGDSCPADSDTYLSSLNNNIYLVDCLNFSRHAVKDQIRQYCEIIAKGTKLVLFNADANKAFHAFLDQHRIYGIFCQDESRTNFIKGIKIILKGGTWVNHNAFAQSRNVATLESNPDIEKGRWRLSRREEEVLDCIAKGMTNGNIAHRYKISQHTVKTHVYNVYRKINVFNRLQAKMWFNKNRDKTKSNFPPVFLEND